MRAIIDRAADARGQAQARIDAQADDIDGVTWVATAAPPGTLVDVRLDDVVDDYDFSATLVTERERPMRPTTRERRALPMATTAGSYGR